MRPYFSGGSPGISGSRYFSSWQLISGTYQMGYLKHTTLEPSRVPTDNYQVNGSHLYDTNEFILI